MDYIGEFIELLAIVLKMQTTYAIESNESSHSINLDHFFPPLSL